MSELLTAAQKTGYTETLETFLNTYFPGLKILRLYDSDTLHVMLPENPATVKADKAVDDAWERNG